MEPDARQKDHRKGKRLSWREAKISLAHTKGCRTPIHGGAIEGGVEAAGRQVANGVRGSTLPVMQPLTK